MAGDEIPVRTEKRSDAVGCIEVAMSSDSKKAMFGLWIQVGAY